MKKILIILTIAIFLVGCGSGAGQENVNYNFKQGIGQLKVSFLNNAPPDKLYPGSDFKMILQVDNQQAYDALNGRIVLVGLDDSYFNVQPNYQDFQELKGRSLLAPGGDKLYFDFDGTAMELFQNSIQYNNPYFLQIHYDSSMDFTDTVCINPNLYDTYDSGCKRKERSSYSGQGAPLAVTNMEQIVFPSGAGANVEFRLELSNRGNGKVGFINLGNGKLGGKPISCEFAGKYLVDKRRVELKNKQQQTKLICKTFLNDQRSYETTLSVDFTYDYDISEQRQLTMVR
ncbi:hypothetical protein HOD05_02450 [Candidatus Woesearchaeota archaeon]|jgi:hypothetical protein|nr:hypothetical protein [Candidatus Woesearchaeota archaeon]MBT4150593.1 hypothetical protein [Candidatus Woesearchaeota archaeon]MBT4434057.1 hypothetical protein [Candidatus Woesearchaeota archaeon]MBT7332110.1 hypothetical protein [Candidatus Woesearchaeota archaeon]